MNLKEAIERLKLIVENCQNSKECQETEFCSDCYIELEDISAIKIVIDYMEENIELMAKNIKERDLYFKKLIDESEQPMDLSEIKNQDFNTLTEEEVNQILMSVPAKNILIDTACEKLINNEIQEIASKVIDKELEKIAEEVPELKKYLKSKEI